MHSETTTHRRSRIRSSSALSISCISLTENCDPGIPPDVYAVFACSRRDCLTCRAYPGRVSSRRNERGRRLTYLAGDFLIIRMQLFLLFVCKMAVGLLGLELRLKGVLSVNVGEDGVEGWKDGLECRQGRSGSWRLHVVEI